MNQLLKQFAQMRKMIKQYAAMQGGGPGRGGKGKGKGKGKSARRRLGGLRRHGPAKVGGHVSASVDAKHKAGHARGLIGRLGWWVGTALGWVVLLAAGLVLMALLAAGLDVLLRTMGAVDNVAAAVATSIAAVASIVALVVVSWAVGRSLARRGMPARLWMVPAGYAAAIGAVLLVSMVALFFMGAPGPLPVVRGDNHRLHHLRGQRRRSGRGGPGVPGRQPPGPVVGGSRTAGHTGGRAVRRAGRPVTGGPDGSFTETAPTRIMFRRCLEPWRRAPALATPLESWR